MADPDSNSARPQKKKGIAAKIVKHAHRRRFQDYLRTKGRDKATIGYVYWSMYLRSGKGNVFELEEGLFLADLGIGKDSLRPARKTLFDDGWLSKATQKVDPLTGKWGTTAWTVNVEPVACSAGVGAVACLTDDGSADVGSPDDGSAGDTVVLHSLDASNPEASTYPVTLTGGTSTGQQTDLLTHSPTSEPAARVGGEDEDKNSNLQSEPEAFSPKKEQKQNQPQEQTTFAAESPELKLYLAIYPACGDERHMKEAYPWCQKLVAGAYGNLNYLLSVLAWNRVHENGKFRIRSAQQFHKAMTSPSASLMNNYESHDFDTCKKCYDAGVKHWSVAEEIEATKEINRRDHEMIQKQMRHKAAQANTSNAYAERNATRTCEYCGQQAPAQSFCQCEIDDFYREEGGMEETMRNNQAKAKAAKAPAFDVNDI